MEARKVSIIMGAYNEKEQWIKQCIDSILNQTYRNIEFIIVLDNPENNKLKEFLDREATKDSRIKLIINEKNLGLVKTLNKAIEASTGYYIARMDADDISYSERIEKQVKYLEENPEIAFLGTKVEFINEDGQVFSVDKFRPSEYEKIKKHLKYGNAFAHPTLMYKAEAIRKLNGYNEILFAEDYELATRFVLNNYKVANLNETLLKYRVRNSGISQSNRTKQFITTEYLRGLYKSGLQGKKVEFNLQELDTLLNDEKTVRTYDNYLDSLEGLSNKKNVGTIVPFIKSWLSSNKIFNIVSGKCIYAIDRKIFK